MKIKTNMIMECSLVLAIILYSCLIREGKGEIEIFTGQDGAGALIACFGILWAIGAFIRLSTGWEYWFSSMATAIGLIVFGYTLHAYGIFHAFCSLGGYLLFLGYIIGPIVPELAKIFFIIGVLLLVIFLPFRRFSTPTKVIAPITVETTSVSQENYQYHL